MAARLPHAVSDDASRRPRYFPAEISFVLSLHEIDDRLQLPLSSRQDLVSSP